MNSCIIYMLYAVTQWAHHIRSNSHGGRNIELISLGQAYWLSLGTSSPPPGLDSSSTFEPRTHPTSGCVWVAQVFHSCNTTLCFEVGERRFTACVNCGDYSNKALEILLHIALPSFKFYAPHVFSHWRYALLPNFYPHVFNIVLLYSIAIDCLK